MTIRLQTGRFRNLFRLDDHLAHQVASTSLLTPWLIGLAGLLGGTLLATTLRFKAPDPNIARFLGWLVLNVAGAIAARYVGVFRFWACMVITVYGLGAILLYWTGGTGLIAHPLPSLLVLVLPLEAAIVWARRSKPKATEPPEVAPLEGQLSDWDTIKRLIVYAVSLLGSALVFIFCALVSVTLVNGPYHSARFDSVKWQAGIPSDRNSTECYERAAMAEDLQRELRWRRPARDEVIAMLGKPDSTSGTNQLSYDLGMCSGLRIDYDTFEIRFDPSGKVSDAFMQQH